MIKVSSVVKLNMPKIKQLTQAQVTALEQTAEALHTEVVQAQVFPRDTGNLQNESTFVDYSNSSKGKVSIISIQSIISRKAKIQMPGANGMKTGFQVDHRLILR